jgi:MFS family permease
MSTPSRPAPTAVVLAGIVSLAVAMGIGRFAFTPVLPLMIAEGQLDIAAGGWIAAANYAGYLVGALTASRMGWPASRLGLVALAATAILTAGMALPLPAAAWALMRFAAGVASAWAFVATAIWCLGALAAQGRTRSAGAVYSGVGFGIAAAGLYCLAASAMHLSAEAMWVQLGVISAVLLLAIAGVIRRSADERPAPASAAATAPAASAEGLLPLVICYGALGFGYILPATFLPVMARSVVEDPRIFGLAWPAFGLTAGASTFVAAWAFRRST